jgi:vitamin B12 transporter
MQASWSVRLAMTLLFLAAISSSAASQEVQDTIRLKELVVTATRTPASADAVVSSITVITGEELRARGIHFVQDALRNVPGAAAVQVGSFGGVSSLFLRGGESDYVKVLIDGVAVNQSGGAYNWANLTTDNLDRIEVLRGPASVLYGSDAVTGVVQIFTRRGEGPMAVEGRAEGGTFGTVGGSATVMGSSRHFSYAAGASRIATDGMYAFNNDYGNTVLSGSLRALPDDVSDLSFSARFADNRHHFPTDFSGMLADSNQSTAETSVALGLDLGRRLSERYELRLSAGGSRTDGEYDDRSDSPGDTVGFAFASTRDSRAQRGVLDGSINAALSPGLMLTAGAQIERETERQSGQSTSNFGSVVTTPDTPFDRGRTTFGYYAQGVLDLVSGLSINLNARVDDNSGFGTFLTYRAGVAYRLPSRTRLRASLGRGFKAPTFCEQFCNAPFVVGDSTLDPERSISWEVGVEQELNDRLSLWAIYFDQRFRDLVVYDGAAPTGAPTYFNGAAAKARGLEVGFAATLTQEVTASVSYTYLESRATDDAGMPSAGFTEGERLIRRPTHSAELSVRGRVLDRVTLGGSMIYLGDRDDVDFSAFPSQRVELPGYVLVDLAGELEILGGERRQLAGVLRVENLFDKRYDQVVGFRARRRGVYGGARFRF